MEVLDRRDVDAVTLRGYNAIHFAESSLARTDGNWCSRNSALELETYADTPSRGQTRTVRSICDLYVAGQPGRLGEVWKYIDCS